MELGFGSCKLYRDGSGYSPDRYPTGPHIDMEGATSPSSSFLPSIPRVFKEFNYVPQLRPAPLRSPEGA